MRNQPFNDMKSRRDRMSQFRNRVDWMDVVVVTGCVAGLALIIMFVWDIATFQV